MWSLFAKSCQRCPHLSSRWNFAFRPNLYLNKRWSGLNNAEQGWDLYLNSAFTSSCNRYIAFCFGWYLLCEQPKGEMHWIPDENMLIIRDNNVTRLLSNKHYIKWSTVIILYGSSSLSFNQNHCIQNMKFTVIFVTFKFWNIILSQNLIYTIL